MMPRKQRRCPSLLVPLGVNLGGFKVEVIPLFLAAGQQGGAERGVGAGGAAPATVGF